MKGTRFKGGKKPYGNPETSGAERKVMAVAGPRQLKARKATGASKGRPTRL